MTSPVPDVRPAPDEVSHERDLRRWYWLRSELVDIARRHGLSGAGSKAELTERVADALAGRPPADRPPRRPNGPQLVAPFHGDMVVPAGQRCSQALRAWFVERVGTGFRFDRAMREVVATGGVTLDDAVTHWHATRDDRTEEIEPQFEYNRFTRAWRAAHPDGDRDDLLAAWWAHRSEPREWGSGAVASDQH